jgi:glycosyltransferase involved in cell wall biosynthesis
MRIAMVTDAWVPQVNGVVRTLQMVRAELEAAGHEVLVIAPDGFLSMPCPTYPEIRLALARSAVVGRRLDAFGAEAIHLATEGPLCLAARRYCLKRGLPFTTAYHTQFPDYVAARTGADPEWIWRYIRWFHAPAHAVLASTPTVTRALVDHGIAQVRPFGRGVDFTHFGVEGPRDPLMVGLEGPVQLYVGRVAVEKNIEAFLASSHPGAKVVVGDGPARADLERRYPHANFLGKRRGIDLAAAYRTADVFVFPSRTDTFGLVMAEALACGTPVAAYPVIGPIDVIDETVGALDEELDAAIARALTRSRDTCAAYAKRFSWPESARQFLNALAPISGETQSTVQQLAA